MTTLASDIRIVFSLIRVATVTIFPLVGHPLMRRMAGRTADGGVRRFEMKLGAIGVARLTRRQWLDLLLFQMADAAGHVGHRHTARVHMAGCAVRRESSAAH